MNEVKLATTINFSEEERKELKVSGLRIVKSAQQVQMKEEAKVIAIKKALAKARREAPLKNHQLRNALREFKKAA